MTEMENNRLYGLLEWIVSLITMMYILDIIFQHKAIQTKKELPSRITDGFSTDAHSFSMDSMKIGNDFNVSSRID